MAATERADVAERVGFGLADLDECGAVLGNWSRPQSTLATASLGRRRRTALLSQSGRVGSQP